MSKPIVHVAVGLLMNTEDLLLMGLRPVDKAYAYKWEWPGGKVEPHEDAADALIREWQEEIGVDVRIDRRLGAALYDSYDLCVLELFSLIISVREMPNIIAREHQELRWVHPLSVEQGMSCTPGTTLLMPFVRNYYSALRRAF